MTTDSPILHLRHKSISPNTNIVLLSTRLQQWINLSHLLILRLQAVGRSSQNSVRLFIAAPPSCCLLFSATITTWQPFLGSYTQNDLKYNFSIFIILMHDYDFNHNISKACFYLNNYNFISISSVPYALLVPILKAFILWLHEFKNVSLTYVSS